MSAAQCNCSPNNHHHDHNRESSRPKTGRLRSSCDFCALSKVKRDRGQPQCSRCIRNEVTCHYSMTRRSSKARHIYTTSGSRTTRARNEPQEEQQQQLSRVGGGRVAEASASLGCTPTTAQSYPLVHDAVNTPDTSSATDFLKQLPMALFEPTGLMPSPSPGISSSSITFSNNDASDQSRRPVALWDAEYRSQGHNDQFTPLSLDLGSTTTAPATSSSSCISKDMGTNEGTVLHLGSEDCMRRALSAINRLHTPAEYSPNGKHTNGCAADTTQPRSLDATLTVNRIAMEKIRLVLSCSCPKTPNVFLLIAFAAQHVLDSYCALTKTQLFLLSSPMGGNDGLDITGESRELATSWAENVPVTIGNYVVEGEAKSKVILQVLRAETKALGGLIDSLVSLSTQAAPKEAVGNMCGGFIDSLQTRYRETMQSLYI